jgi:hypothetical protein
LDDQVHGAEIGDEEVEIKIQRLLDDLGGDEEVSSPVVGCAPWSKTVEDLSLDLCAVADGKAAVEERDPLLPETLAPVQVGLARVAHGVANPGDAATGVEGLRDLLLNLVRGAKRHYLDAAGGRRAGGEVYFLKGGPGEMAH